MSRVPVTKTYKIYIGGKFPRTESGRYFPLEDKKGNIIANVCRGSRKDFRNAVVAARKAQANWAKASAYLRGQILYRIAEMLDVPAHVVSVKAKTNEHMGFIGHGEGIACLASVLLTKDEE